MKTSVLEKIAETYQTQNLLFDNPNKINSFRNRLKKIPKETITNFYNNLINSSGSNEDYIKKIKKIKTLEKLTGIPARKSLLNKIYNIIDEGSNFDDIKILLSFYRNMRKDIKNTVEEKYKTIEPNKMYDLYENTGIPPQKKTLHNRIKSLKEKDVNLKLIFLSSITSSPKTSSTHQDNYL